MKLYMISALAALAFLCAYIVVWAATVAQMMLIVIPITYGDYLQPLLMGFVLSLAITIGLYIMKR